MLVEVVNGDNNIVLDERGEQRSIVRRTKDCGKSNKLDLPNGGWVANY